MKKEQVLAYCGPNRRSDHTMVEVLLSYGAPDIEHLERHRSEAAQFLEQQFEHLDLPVPVDGFDQGHGNPVEQFGRWCAAIGLALQTATGHRVTRQDLLPEPERSRLTVLFEHEDSEIGERAGELSLYLLSLAMPGLEWARPVLADAKQFKVLIDEFRAVSLARVMPRDAEAIMRAAHKAGVPVVKLERDPYKPVQGGFRIRMNSMLMLGHAGHRKLTDGTLALEQARFDSRLILGRSAALQLLAAEELPVPETRSYVQPSFGPSRARRLRDELGGRVAVKPGRRTGGVGVSVGLTEPRSIGRALDAALRHDREVLVQALIPGDTYRLLFANHRLEAALGSDGRRVEETGLDAGMIKKLVELTRMLNAGLVMFTLVSRDPSVSLEESGGVFTDMEVAPEIDRHTEAVPELLEAAAEHFIEWLFPQGVASRIPIVSITGTNGKTTTSRMINHVLRSAGKAPGMVCTEGIYIGEEMVETADLSNLMGHYRVYESTLVDCAVLEANHRGLAAYGVSFDWCDVAVVTNVTEDHLGDWGVETIEDMAAVKRSLAERGRAVILNADDSSCISMIPRIDPKQLLLTSLQESGQSLLEREPRALGCVVLGQHAGEECIELHVGGDIQRVANIAEVPMTFGGAARFNVSNALQSVAACYLLGVAPEQIGQALAGFKPGLQTTPGRLNLFDDLPFRIVVDFAHNPDGFRRLAEFVDTLEVPGRKLIAMSASGNRSNAFAERIAAACAGHYDDYLCKDYSGLRGRGKNELPLLLKRSLVKNGVDENHIVTMGEEAEPVQAAFSYCREGDLLVLIMGNNEFYAVPDEIRKFKDSTSSNGG